MRAPARGGIACLDAGYAGLECAGGRCRGKDDTLTADHRLREPIEQRPDDVSRDNALYELCFRSDVTAGIGSKQGRGEVVSQSEAQRRL